MNPFDSVTIASVCMNVYRTKFLEEDWRVKLAGDSGLVPAKYMDGCMKVLRGDQWVSVAEVVIGEKEFVRSPIAKIPPGGYKIYQYSKSSLQYLEWVSRRDGVKIQHILNGGEVRLPGTRYKLDGYCQGKKHCLRISRMRVPRMSPMFSGRLRRDETSSYPSIHERTLRSDHEKEILYRRKGHEICLYVRTRISRDLPKRPGTQTLSPEFRHYGQTGSTREFLRR